MWEELRQSSHGAAPVTGGPSLGPHPRTPCPAQEPFPAGVSRPLHPVFPPTLILQRPGASERFPCRVTLRPPSSAETLGDGQKESASATNSYKACVKRRTLVLEASPPPGLDLLEREHRAGPTGFGPPHLFSGPSRGRPRVNQRKTGLMLRFPAPAASPGHRCRAPKAPPEAPHTEDRVRKAASQAPLLLKRLARPPSLNSGSRMFGSCVLHKNSEQQCAYRKGIGLTRTKDLSPGANGALTGQFLEHCFET